jgi:two-component system, chemotaxis family, chemotaxis protein CheY
MNILVVEDSLFHFKVVKKIISFALPKADIIHAVDAFDAWSALKGLSHVGLMVLDHNMPYAKGGDFLQKVRDTPIFKNLPVIMLTGETNGNKFIELGANAYFGKPFDPSKFKALIASLGLDER